MNNPLRPWLIVGAYAALIVSGVLIGRWLSSITLIDLRPSNDAAAHAMLVLATAIYIVASAIPFVPGAEIGLAMVVTFGVPIVALVYTAMVGALLLAFVVGRFVPPRAVAAALGAFGLHRARNLVSHLAPLDADARLAFLTERAPSRVIPFLLRRRHVALAVVLNLPGNSLIGGAGGIALVAGMSGLYSLSGYVVTILVAVAPIPVGVLLFGYVPGG